MDNRYKADSIVSSFVDRRDLAVIAQWLWKKEKKISNKAELLRICVQSMANMIVASGEVAKVEFSSDATKILEQLGVTGLNSSNRLRRNYADNLRLDNALMEPEEIQTEFPRPEPTKEEKNSRVTQDVLNRGVAMYRTQKPIPLITRRSRKAASDEEIG